MYWSLMGLVFGILVVYIMDTLFRLMCYTTGKVLQFILRAFGLWKD